MIKVINMEQISDLKVRAEAIKLLEENKREKSSEPWDKDFLEDRQNQLKNKTIIKSTSSKLKALILQKIPL